MIKACRNIESDNWLLKDIGKRDGKLEEPLGQIKWYPPNQTKVCFT